MGNCCYIFTFPTYQLPKDRCPYVNHNQVVFPVELVGKKGLWSQKATELLGDKYVEIMKVIRI